MPATGRHPRKNMLRWLLALAILPLLAPLSPAANAQIGSARYSSIIIEAGSGDVLEAANPDAPRHPASLTKMMTLYMTFEALRDRRIRLDQFVPVSAHAAAMAPTKLGLMPGTRITVDQAILGLVTKSANDAAAALSELLGGSEDRFAQMMTLRARALGMSKTTFTNASGLPDPEQITTARDLGILGRRLVTDFPGYYRYFATPSFVWQRRVIFNHDNLLRSYPGADGMKTGYTDASGHNLVSSAVRGGVRLVGVVLGAASNGERDAHMASLLNRGFAQLDVAVEHPVTQVASHGTLISSAHATPVETARPTARGRSAWAIQVGSFASERAAREAASTARRIADGGEIRIENASTHHRTAWRAQIVGLTQSEAQDACSTLSRRKMACFIVRPEAHRVALLAQTTDATRQAMR